MRIIGLDLAITSAHKAIVMDEKGQYLTPVFAVLSWAEELAGLLRRAREGEAEDCPLVVVLEPTGLAWLPVAIYLVRHGVTVYLVNSQQVSDLRRFYKKHAKSDRIDAKVLAKLYLVAQEKLHALRLPAADLYTLQRACKQLDWVTGEVTKLTNQINSLDQVVWLGGWATLVFSDPLSATARWCRAHYYNPYTVRRVGPAQIQQDYLDSGLAGSEDAVAWIPALVQLAEKVVGVYGDPCEYVDFEALQAETILRQASLVQLETQRDQLKTQVILPLYRRLHPSGNLHSLYGVGEESAAVFLSYLGDPLRFPDARHLRGWSGMVPDSKQSSDREAKGLHISQAGPDLIKKFAYLDADTARRYDPQLAKLYYDQMVHHGKHHTQAVCAVATHLLDRIWVIATEDRPYELRDVDGTPVTPQRAREIIAEKYTVPEEVRKRNRRRARNAKTHPPAVPQRQRKRESSPDLVRG
jgi:transposase